MDNQQLSPNPIVLVMRLMLMLFWVIELYKLDASRALVAKSTKEKTQDLRDSLNNNYQTQPQKMYNEPEKRLIEITQRCKAMRKAQTDFERNPTPANEKLKKDFERAFDEFAQTITSLYPNYPEKSGTNQPV